MKNRLYKILFVVGIAFVLSLSILSMSVTDAFAHSDAVEKSHEHSGNTHICNGNGINLEALNFTQVGDNENEVNPHSASSMNSSAGAQSNCTGDGTWCPDTCNAYMYKGSHYNSSTIPYTIGQSVIDEPGLENMVV